MNSLSIVVYTWSRLCLLPILPVLLMAMRTAPAMGWPRGARGAGVAAWLALALVPFPGHVTLGDSDLFVLMVLVVLASRTDGTTLAAPLIAGWMIMVLAAAAAFGTLVVARMTHLELWSMAGAAYGIALLVGGWLWWQWPRHTLPQRLSMAAMAQIWAGIACAPWDWSWQQQGVVGAVLALTAGVWWLRPIPRG